MPRPLSNLLRATLLLVGLLAVGAEPQAKAQGRFSFKTYASEAGLDNLAVWCLAQDPQGFLWAGTEDGLFRFDGARFMPFGLKEGLPSSYVESLHVGPDGTLWVGTFKGLAYWRDGRFQAVGPDSGLPFVPIKGLGTGPDGQIWVGTAEGPFRGGRNQPFEGVKGWPGGSVTALATPKGGGRLWVASWTKVGTQVHAWDSRGWQLGIGQSPFGQERIDALAVDGEATVWARSPRKLWSMPAGATRFEEERSFPMLQQKGHLMVDAAGKLWATSDAGLYRREDKNWVRLGVPEGLPRAMSTALLEDREGSLWVAGEGLYRLQGGGLLRSFSAQDGMANDTVWCITRDVAGELLVGTDNGLLRLQGGRWVVVPGTGQSQVRSVAPAPEGLLWAVGGPEVTMVDPLRGVQARFGRSAGVVVARIIFRIQVDPTGTPWLATDGAGLLKGIGKGRVWRFERVELPGGSSEERIEDLQLDAKGRLWAAGERGLAVLEGGRWQRLGQADGLRSDHVSYVRPLRDGSTLVTYFDPLGLCQVRFEQGRFKIEGHRDDLVTPDHIVYMLGEDPKGALWIGTGRGLERIASNGEREQFGRGEGLVSENVNGQAILAELDDVWVGTASGLARFDARAYRSAPQPPKTVLLRSVLGRQAYPSVPIEAIRVPRAQGTFEVKFAGLSFIREGRLQYHARLLGLEHEWHPVDTREDRYPALGPGLYRYEVRARIGQGLWGPSATFEFQVLPAWWQTWWFRVLAGLAALGGISWVIRWRVAHLHDRNQVLESMVHARTREVEAKARELEQANLALRNQSLTDPLTGLRNRRYLGVCMPEDVAQVDRIHRDAHLGRFERLRMNIDLVFIMVDLDHFKTVNDQHGHAAGDHVLQQVAEILRDATRDSDTVIRWGGEEFLIVARNASRAESAVVVERIRSQVEAHAFDIGGGETLRSTCSLGFTFYPFVPEKPELFPWEHVVDLSDHCLYAAKRSGRNAWVGLFPTLEGEADLIRRGLPNEIPQLIEQGHIQVVTSVSDPTRLQWDLHG